MSWLPLANEGVPLDNELIARVGWLIQLRWVAGSAILTGAAIVALAHEGALPIALVGAAALAYNVLLARAHRRLVSKGQAKAVHWRLFAHVQILLDWVALTILSGLTGGLESPLMLLYTMHVILAAMLLPRQQCLFQTTIGLFLIAELARAGLPGSSLHLGDNPLAVVRVYGDEYRVLAYVLTLGGWLYACAFLSSSIGERLRARERELLNVKNREERMHAEMALLHEVAKSINATLDPDVVLQHIVERATTITRALGCSIRLLSESGELPISAAYGLSEAYLQKGTVDLTRSPIDRKALFGEPVLIDDTAKHDLFQYPQELAREGIRSLLVIPLMAGTEVLGVIRLYFDAPHAFGEEDVQFAQNFANLAAIALRNAQTYRMLQDADKERSRFVRTVAHELRSPLSAILGNLRIILQGYAGPAPEKVTQLLQRAHERGNLLLALAGDLLALVSGRDAAAVKAHEPLSLAQIVRQVAGDLSAAADAKSIQVQIEAPDGDSDVIGDREQLIRVVDNLVSNAIKYTLDGGHVSIRVRREDGSVELVVEDTGIGIPAAMQAHLFEEFFRAENARRLTENGTGLGLAIVKRLVELHRGKIALESEEGRYTRVTVIFPAASREQQVEGS